MQSHGAAGAVQCSAAAAALIEAQGGGASGLRLTEREGGVEVKSLGRSRTFWVSLQGPEDSDGPFLVEPEASGRDIVSPPAGTGEVPQPCGPARCSPKAEPTAGGSRVPSLVSSC